MIRGSTYSAIMHAGIVLLILFGLPGLTLLLPIWEKEEVPVPVVLMNEKDADEISKKQAKAKEQSEAKKAADQSEDSTSDQQKTDQQQVKSSKDAQGKNAEAAPATEVSSSSPPEKPGAINKEEDEKSLSRKAREKPKPPEQKRKGTINVVTDFNPHAEGTDGKTTTRDPGEDDAASVERSPEVEQNGKRKTPQTGQSKSDESAQAAKFPTVGTPAPQGQQQQAFQAPNVGTMPRTSSGAPPPAAPSPAQPPPVAPSLAQPPPTTGSVPEQISTVISEMAEKIPRLKSLRESLTQQNANSKSSPALEQSAKRMEERAEEGYAHAQFTLAEMYLTGEGVPRDEKKAVALLNRAAISGFLPAQLTLGMMAAEGRGMERNLAEAQTWLSVAADQGNRAAQEAVPKLEKLMAPRDTIEARKRSFQLNQVLVIVHGGDLKKASKTELSERLRIAAALGDVESGHVLLAQGADADSPDLDGRTAVIEAAWRGYPRIVKSLIDNGANLSATDNTKKTAVMWAAINGHAGVIENLVKAGASVNDQDNEGMTALMRAAWNGHAKAVRALLAHKAAPNIRDSKGQTARDYAVKIGNAEIRELLTRAASGG